jgi:hypothetical protein
MRLVPAQQPEKIARAVKKFVKKIAPKIVMFLSLWGSLEAIKRFAGDDDEKAGYYPDDKNFLLELEPTVSHYEILAQP